jgi:hypothetical protein
MELSSLEKLIDKTKDHVKWDYFKLTNRVDNKELHVKFILDRLEYGNWDLDYLSYYIISDDIELFLKLIQKDIELNKNKNKCILYLYNPIYIIDKFPDLTLEDSKNKLSICIEYLKTFFKTNSTISYSFWEKLSMHSKLDPEFVYKYSDLDYPWVFSLLTFTYYDSINEINEIKKQILF